MFKQKIKITMTDISSKNLLPKECHDIYILHQFSWDHNKTPVVASNTQGITYSTLSHHAKIRFNNVSSNFGR